MRFVATIVAAVVGGAAGLSGWIMVQRSLQDSGCDAAALCSTGGNLGLWPLAGAFAGALVAVAATEVWRRQRQH